MIKIIDGDLFNTDAKFICHQVNCKGVMGSGVALQVKQKFPHVYEEYRKCVEVTSPDILGQIQVVPCNPKYLHFNCGSIAVPETEQWICNLFAQNGYGYDGKQYTSEEALRNCFEKINRLTYEKNNNFDAKIAMPFKIGCCRGGANWDMVYSMIDEIFSGREVELWRFDKG